jgi:hypothetical protein
MRVTNPSMARVLLEAGADPTLRRVAGVEWHWFWKTEPVLVIGLSLFVEHSARYRPGTGPGGVRIEIRNLINIKDL